MWCFSKLWLHDPGTTVLFEQPGLAVRVASPRYLLAMKVMAARVERDEDDIIRLAELSGTTTVSAILDLVQIAYPHASIPPRVQYFLEEVLGRRSDRWPAPRSRPPSTAGGS